MTYPLRSTAPIKEEFQSKVNLEDIDVILFIVVVVVVVLSLRPEASTFLVVSDKDILSGMITAIMKIVNYTICI